MSIAQTYLRESRTFDTGDALSFRVPNESQVVIKRSSKVPTGSRVTFVPASNNCLFLDESGTYVDKALVPRGRSARLTFNEGLLDVQGPARVSSNGLQGQFKGGGSATWTLPDSQGSHFGQQSTTLRNNDTFTGIGNGVRQKQSVLTIEVSPEQQGLASLHLEGGDIDLFSMPGFLIEDLFMKTNGGYSTVHNTDAHFAKVESNRGTQHLVELNAIEYTGQANGGTIYGTKESTGQGKYETNCGAVIAYAPQESAPGEEANTLEIKTNGGPVTLMVPEVYSGSVRASSRFGDCMVDGMPQDRGSYRQGLESNAKGRNDGVTVNTNGGDIEIEFEVPVTDIHDDASVSGINTPPGSVADAVDRSGSEVVPDSETVEVDSPFNEAGDRRARYESWPTDLHDDDSEWVIEPHPASEAGGIDRRATCESGSDTE